MEGSRETRAAAGVCMYAVSFGIVGTAELVTEVVAVEAGVTCIGVGGAVTSTKGVVCREEEERRSRLALEPPFFLDADGAMAD